MMIQGQKKSELVLYVVLWAILFAAAALSVYWDGLNPTPEEMLSGVSAHVSHYDWSDLFGTWRFLSLFCITFFVHNFLLAPLLVYQNKKWQYGIVAVLLMAMFLGYLTSRNSHPVPKEHLKEMKMPPPPKDDLDRMKEVHGHPKDGGRHPLKAKPFGGPTAVAFNIMLLLCGLNVGAKYYFKSLDDRKRMKELERDNLNQQLQYLKYQINPHFFMNTLNNIHALVDIDPEEAKHTIEVLSKLMRYVLYDADKPMAPLQKELDFLGHYIDLMRIRYTDKVRITVSLPTSVQDIQVPSLLLATFVENAFKHGVSYQKDSFIEVSLRVDDVAREIDFLCYNSKKPEAEEKQAKASSNKKGGVGLQNAIKRLKLIYGNEYELKIDSNADEHRLLLRLPFK